MSTPAPLPRPIAFLAVARCAVTTVLMLARRRVHLPREHVGMHLRFADDTTGRVYRETTVDRSRVRDACVLVVSFRLRRVRGRRGHALFRIESLLNTPLFVGFPGFVSKLWVAHDELGLYRGVYEWDGAGRAERYARSLWQVLALVSEPDSIDFHVLPGVRRDDLLGDPAGTVPSRETTWWRLVDVA